VDKYPARSARQPPGDGDRSTPVDRREHAGSDGRAVASGLLPEASRHSVVSRLVAVESHQTVVHPGCGPVPPLGDPGGMGEADVSTEQSQAFQDARLPAADVDARRARRPQGPSSQGPAAPVGLIWRIRDRATFVRFRSEGRRFRHGRLWVNWVPDPDAVPPRVAYAFPRVCGPAVVRNRTRRRLRTALGAAASAGRLPAGHYLIGSGSELHDCTMAEVSAAVEAWCGRFGSRP
jgi:ribonuclease P protein component